MKTYKASSSHPLRLIIALALLLSSALSQWQPAVARAETLPQAAAPLRILDNAWGANEAYLEKYPDRAIEEIEVDYGESGQTNLLELAYSESWDVAILNTDRIDLKALDADGLLMDLSGEPTAMKRLAGLYPVVREAVTSGERVLGVPFWLDGLVMQLALAYPYSTPDGEVDVLGQLGFTQSDAPHTFDELCELATRYMALGKQQRKGTVFNIDASAGNPKRYFLSYLIWLYSAQMCGENGAVDYDAPEFRHALESLNSMSAALQKDKKISYGKGARVSGLVRDNSSALMGNDPLLLRIGDWQSIPVRIMVAVVNPHTARLSEAMDFVAMVGERSATQFAPLLYEQLDYDAMAKRSFEETIAAQRDQGESQEVLDELTRLWNAGDVSHFFYTKEEIEAYRENVAPHLVFPRVPFMDTDALAKQYANGNWDADRLIEELNALAAEI